MPSVKHSGKLANSFTEMFLVCLRKNLWYNDKHTMGALLCYPLSFFTMVISQGSPLIVSIDYSRASIYVYTLHQTIRIHMALHQTI